MAPEPGPLQQEGPERWLVRGRVLTHEGADGCWHWLKILRSILFTDSDDTDMVVLNLFFVSRSYKLMPISVGASEREKQDGLFHFTITRVGEVNNNPK